MSSITPRVSIITDVQELREVAGLLNCQDEIAVDLEMDSLHHFQEKVCLIQLSTRSNDWLIDPLALEDLSPLGRVLADPRIRIVMHGADYDIRSLYRDFKIEVTNLFDTMLAARFVGITEFGLAALIKERFGVELNKKYQKADWSKRPLSPEMCAYAAADTQYLLALHDQLQREVAVKERLTWLNEECTLVCRARMSAKEGPLYTACKGTGRLNRRSLGILEELLQFREQQACLLDRPPFKVFSVETLLELAEKRPASIAELGAIVGMSQKQVNRYGESLIAVIAAGCAMPDACLPKLHRKQRAEPADGSKERLGRLKQWRESYCRTAGLEPGVVAPNWLLEDLANRNPGTEAELADIGGMRDWQKESLGKQMLYELATV